MRDNPDDKSNVVTLRPNTPTEKHYQREREARLLATLGALPALEYERNRLEAAKQLKCRVYWLDKIIREIRGKAAFHSFPAQDGRTAGEAVTFVRSDGSEITGFIVAADPKSQDHLLVLADGNATIVHSTLLTDERIAERNAHSPKSPAP